MKRSEGLAPLCVSKYSIKFYFRTVDLGDSAGIIAGPSRAT
ncbi:hypothetical protein P5929_30270 [Bacillus cereus]|nr:hypothetical protein [Bacillus cereus]MDF9507250.1 hypothetical protein [Bacillus cereus]MDF9610378.1 hypothetical protein [Bacillus cereus]MDF9661277.1 hypothetical protein [Bacillus cereus]